jgi:predicted TPR repeat methyltransferase
MDPTDHNRRAWDEFHRQRADAMQEQLGLPDPVRNALADLKGKRVLHLHCATGEATIELAELGAMATGVDSSNEALDLARERGPSILWMQGDVQALPAELRRGRFDLVYTGEGVVSQLQDLDAWASGIASALKPGGDLLLFEEHPVAICVEPLGRWREDYFDSNAQEEHQRFWRLGQIVTALARAGLAIRALEEYPGPTSWRHRDPKLPGTFLLHARRPA